jgi:hypothetical protein
MVIKIKNNIDILFEFSFPNLRIVRKKADDLKTHGDLRVFDSPSTYL